MAVPGTGAVRAEPYIGLHVELTQQQLDVEQFGQTFDRLDQISKSVADSTG
ncbi:MAG TPA: hypothetical protein PKB14_23280 [Rubrivivax sp.]|nr:hypothetical protein [Rubrivivax sp.]